MKQKDNVSPARRIAVPGMLACIALILSYVEALIPFNFGIPGVKLGLANLAVVVALYLLPVGEALLVDAVKILVTGLLFGTGASLLYSLCGGLLSFAAMALSRRSKRFGCAGVSVLGGVFHNVGQLAAAAFVMGTAKIAYYGPVLLAAGVGAGLLIGLVAGRLIPLLRKASAGRR